MVRITKRDRAKIERVRQRKERVLSKVKVILGDICADNPDILKKAPEGRVKSLRCIEEKIKKIKDCNVNNFEEHIRDIAGARCTCCTLDEIG